MIHNGGWQRRLINELRHTKIRYIVDDAWKAFVATVSYANKLLAQQCNKAEHRGENKKVCEELHYE